MSASIVPFKIAFLEEVKEIFFESSTKKIFKDQAEKDAFFYKYGGFYLEHFPQYAFVARDHRVLGYILGASETNRNDLFQLQPHLAVFEKYFLQYPAHLHINCHSASRGQGIGGKLLTHLENQFKIEGLCGLHIITGINARNKDFYRRLAFDQEIREDFHGSGILLMGKCLSRE